MTCYPRNNVLADISSPSISPLPPSPAPCRSPPPDLLLPLWSTEALSLPPCLQHRCFDFCYIQERSLLFFPGETNCPPPPCLVKSHYRMTCSVTMRPLRRPGPAGDPLQRPAPGLQTRPPGPPITRSSHPLPSPFPFPRAPVSLAVPSILHLPTLCLPISYHIAHPSPLSSLDAAPFPTP